MILAANTVMRRNRSSDPGPWKMGIGCDLASTPAFSFHCPHFRARIARMHMFDYSLNNDQQCPASSRYARIQIVQTSTTLDALNATSAAKSADQLAIRSSHTTCSGSEQRGARVRVWAVLRSMRVRAWAVVGTVGTVGRLPFHRHRVDITVDLGCQCCRRGRCFRVVTTCHKKILSSARPARSLQTR